MAKLPEVGSLPVARARGANQFNVSVGNPYSGIAQGLTAFGQAVAEEQHKEDTLRAEDAYNRLQKKRLDLTNGEQGFTNVKSYDVVSRPLYKEYDESYSNAVDEISNTLSNEEQKKMFKRRADVSRLQFASDLTSHIQNEKNAYAEQVFKGGKAVELENAATNWSKPGAVKFSIERTKRLIEQQSDRQGWSPDVEKAEVKQAVSDIHESVISQAVATDNPDYARQYFDKHKKHILGTEHPKIEDLIREGGIKVLAQEFTDQIILEGKDEKTALAEARKKFKGDERDAVIKFIRDRFSEIDRLKDEKEKQAGHDAWKIYAETRDINQIPLTLLREMNGKERAILEDKAKKDLKGVDSPSGGKDYYQLKMMARDDLKQFKDQNLLAYDLSEADRKELIKLQTEPEEMNYATSAQNIIDQGMAGAGLEPKELEKDSTAGEEARAFSNRINKEVDAYRALTGKAPDDKALQEIVDRQAIKVIRKRWWWADKETPAGILELEGVPKDLVDDIAANLKAMGEEVTEENIKKVYFALEKEKERRLNLTPKQKDLELLDWALKQ